MSQDIDVGEAIRDLSFGRGHSWRNFEPEEFRRVILAAEDQDNLARHEAGLREALQYIEDGRFEEMLAETHDFIWPLDRDELQEWADRNPDMAKWVHIYARLNHLSGLDNYISW